MPDDSLNDANLDPGTGAARDLLLDANGDLALIGGDLVLVRGDASAAQEVQVRLRFFLGEWFLDILAGVPYHDQVLTKPPNLERSRSVLRRAIEESFAVARVEDVSLTFVRAERRLEVGYRAVLDSGEVVAGDLEV